MRVYYNEIDPYCCAWLKNLTAKKLIPAGDIDGRDIRDVCPGDLRGYNQCHFFAGIGIWARAVADAGWPDDRPVWTASCPCQPFSQAGKGAGFADERHLWPDLFWLIEQCRPVTILGEQVASRDGYAWLDLVQADLEGSRHAFGACVAPAAGFGAPIGRHRIYWMANAFGSGLEVGSLQNDGRRALWNKRKTIGQGGVENALAGANGGRWVPRQQAEPSLGYGNPLEPDGGSSALAGADDGGRQWLEHGERRRRDGRAAGWAQDDGQPAVRGPLNGSWADGEWFECLDGKQRCAQPGAYPLAHGAPARNGRLRAYGNTIVLPQAIEFIKAVLACRP